MRTPPEKPFCGGQWTRARYFQFLRSALRTASMKWNPIWQCLKLAEYGVRVNPKTKRKAMHFTCSGCESSFPRKEVQVDHIIPAGSLTCHEDLPGFVERLFCEVDGLRVLCIDCHLARKDESKAPPPTGVFRVRIRLTK